MCSKTEEMATWASLAMRIRPEDLHNRNATIEQAPLRAPGCRMCPALAAMCMVMESIVARLVKDGSKVVATCGPSSLHHLTCEGQLEPMWKAQPWLSANSRATHNALKTTSRGDQVIKPEPIRPSREAGTNTPPTCSRESPTSNRGNWPLKSSTSLSSYRQHLCYGRVFQSLPTPRRPLWWSCQAVWSQRSNEVICSSSGIVGWIPRWERL